MSGTWLALLWSSGSVAVRVRGGVPPTDRLDGGRPPANTRDKEHSTLTLADARHSNRLFQYNVILISDESPDALFEVFRGFLSEPSQVIRNRHLSR